MGKITRITSIDLEGIRGFLAKLDRPLNTDGDIVLLAGANGCGKTSLLDALCLALTNYNKNTKMVSAGKAEGKLTICYKKDDEDKIWENSIPAYNNGKWQWKDEKSLLVQYKDKKFNWPQFLARNTFFHQEEAKRIISDKENDNSISSIFFPQPAYKDKLIHELEGFRSKVGRL
ncbi:MAG: AAA family ATPase, partial [Phycisphaerales bacterium]